LPRREIQILVEEILQKSVLERREVERLRMPYIPWERRASSLAAAHCVILRRQAEYRGRRAEDDARSPPPRPLLVGSVRCSDSEADSRYTERIAAIQRR
jgi:hypothetical protein